MRSEHFGRGGGFLFGGTTNKKFLKFVKFDFKDVYPRLPQAPLIRSNKVETAAVRRWSILYTYITYLCK